MGVIEAGSKESRARKRSWRGDLRDAALGALEDRERLSGAREFSGALALTVVIVRRRPSAQMGSGRNAGIVKAWALDALPVERPDTLKIVRAAEDALTGVVWADDSRLVCHALYKAFGDQAGLSWDSEGLFIVVEQVQGFSGPRVALVGRANDRRSAGVERGVDLELACAPTPALVPRDRPVDVPLSPDSREVVA
jgi:hypothetical protein